jgi:hypothetical protein
MGRSLAQMARQVPARVGSWAWTPVLRQLGTLALEAVAERWLERQARPPAPPAERPATVATRSRAVVVARADQPGRALVIVEQVQVRVQPPGEAPR